MKHEKNINFNNKNKKDINKYLDESFSNIIRNTLKDQMQAYAAYYAFVFLRKLFYEEVFSKDCTMLSIKKMLYENYYRDVVLQKDKLVEIINEYFHETLKLKNNIFSFKTITENTISNLLSLEVFDKREEVYLYCQWLSAWSDFEKHPIGSYRKFGCTTYVSDGF